MQADLFKANPDIYTVSRLNFEIATLFNRNFPAIWITGEISNLARPQSGHIYFSLKDNKAQTRCAMFVPQQRMLNFSPKNGDQVMLQANVTLYEARGEYQLKILKMTEVGNGELQQKLTQLKLKLRNLGWFDSINKQPLPTMPTKIGVITSPSGAVIHDIITTLNRRFPLLQIIIYPTIVQGNTAANNICQMINLANQRNDCQALIIARGGGSLEDLWAFNEETVVATIYHSNIPIVSAIGHESDATLSDLVADYRAATPTAAAEILSPDSVQLKQKITKLAQQLQHKTQYILANKNHAIELLSAQLPVPKFYQLNMHLDEINYELNNLITKKTNVYKSRLDYLLLRLHAKNPQSMLGKYQQNLQHLTQRLTPPNISQKSQLLQALQAKLALALNHQQHKINQRIITLAARLNIASPLKTLARGYAIVSDENSNLIQDASTVSNNDKINIRLNKGKIIAKVISSN